MNSQELIEKVKETRIIPVFSHDDPETAYQVVKACYDGGIRVFEFTNRSAKAIDSFKYLVSRKSNFPGLALGIGTIMDRSQGELFYEAGAEFIVAPIVDAELAAFCQEKAIAWTPGCGTLTEVITAERLGAKLMKVFPADVLGPKFIKGVLGPCGHLNLMPTGGVTPEKANLESWFNAGVVCVGMGSQLISKEMIQNQQYKELTEVVKAALDTIKSIKK